MTGDELPDDGHVVRHAKGAFIDRGIVNGSAFELRQTDTGLSVNWLECFQGLTKARQLDEIRRLSRLKMRRSGRLVELNVGATKRHVGSLLETLGFILKPLDADDDHEADPSHSEIIGLPPQGSPDAAKIGDMIAESVTAVHPAFADE